MQTLVLATRNAGKLREIGEGLAADPRTAGIALQLVSDYTDTEPTEDGGTYLANATIKARAALAASSLPSLADDAGIEFDCLPGRFGVETAPEADAMGGWTQAADHIASLIAAGAPATCRHRVTFALALPDGTSHNVTATVEGRFVHPARGNDWGFNPYFVPNGESLTYAEIKPRHGLAAKNAASARGLALGLLIETLVAVD